MSLPWHPLPSSLLAELLIWRPTKGAPEAHVWLWIRALVIGGTEPSIRDVADYAGWGKTKATRVRRDSLAWYAAWDAENQTGDTKRDSRGTVAGQSRDTEPQQNQTTYSHARDTRGTPAGHPRDDRARDPSTHKTPTPTPTREDPPLDDLWAEVVAFTTKPAAWKLNATRRRWLAARVEEHGADAVRDVARWVRTSSHGRADFLRENGDPETLLRQTKFPKYLAMAQSPVVLPRAKNHPHTPRNGTAGLDALWKDHHHGDEDSDPEHDEVVEAEWSIRGA